MLTERAKNLLVAAMRENIPHQINCDLCGGPLGDDRREVMHGPFPVGVHPACRDLIMSYRLDHRKRG